MGLAASQARLLSITARMHDVEYQAQNIMSQKIQLATLEDAAYEEYCNALDAKKIQVAYGVSGNTTKYIDATFENVCTYDETGMRKCQYALTDAKTGKMVVESDVYDAYEEYQNDKYSFAWAMLGFVEGGDYSDFSWSDAWGNNVGINSGTGDEGADGHVILSMTDAEEIVFNNHSDDSQLTNAYKSYQETLENDDIAKQRDALENFRNVLYSDNKRKAEIYDLMRLDKTDDKESDLINKNYMSSFPDDFNDGLSSKFQYYANLFDGIRSCGGCIDITDFSDAYTSDNNWFNNVVNSGAAYLHVYNPNGPNKGWKETSVASSLTENYLKESQDEADIKKAEVKYEHEMKKIKNKDAKFDQDLQNLETERTALKTELDSIKKVKDDNVERTFGIFS